MINKLYHDTDTSVKWFATTYQDSILYLNSNTTQVWTMTQFQNSFKEKFRHRLSVWKNLTFEQTRLIDSLEAKKQISSTDKSLIFYDAKKGKN